MASEASEKRFILWNLEKIFPGESIPAPLYLLLEGRHVKYRDRGQSIDRYPFDRMELKKVRDFYILEQDQREFEAWHARLRQTESQKTGEIQSVAALQKLSDAKASLGAKREQAKRNVADIFHSFHAEESITVVLETSTQLVGEITKSPFTAQPLKELQTLSRGTADHSVNVSILSVYIALNMGYSHMVILRHLAAGALLHDIGKIEALRLGEGAKGTYDMLIKNHPAIGAEMLASSGTMSQEVQMIVAQHHECHDGSGYPRGLHGDQIYDLAKIVAIANAFDGLVAEGKGPLAERQKHALAQLSGPLASQFNPMKLKKIVKILSLGI